VFTQSFDDPAQVERYAAFMGEVAQLVAVEFGGSLKAEHGTGRNMAPFVELEWGGDAYQLMWKIKRLLDPQGILNPDVVLSEDPGIHLKNLKPMPAANEIIDKCIECGFCEPVCPSNGLSLSPRQRIVIWRDIQAKKRAGVDTRELEEAYQYQGIDTCAATGLCAQRCPVGINTGDLVRELRAGKAHHNSRADWLAAHFATALKGTRLMLAAADTANRLLGAPRLQRWTEASKKLSGGRVPSWNPATPQPVRWVEHAKPAVAAEKPRVVYLPACVSHAMGPARSDSEQAPLLEKTRQLLEKAGYEVVFPEIMDSLCCGQPFASKGYPQQADRKRSEMLAAVKRASRDGRDPIYCDTSPCTLRLLQQQDHGLDIYDPVRFIRSHLLDRLEFMPQSESVAVHVTCSTQHLGEGQALIDIARKCSTHVVVPEDIHCCGFAGDKGFTTPELNGHALRTLQPVVQHCTEGVSTSRTCEIGLSSHSGVDYHSLVYLVDRVTRPVQALA
jgi:D-lactate dehydrogenase